MARPDQAARGPAVWMLALGQTLSYACLYYIFAALILSWEADLGWDRALLATGPFIAILISAALAPFAGRIVDLGKGPEAMVTGAVIGAMALVLLAISWSPASYLVAWGLIGLAQSVTLYETCFAFLIRRLGRSARAAIVRVTLVAGFASTIAFPAGAALSAWIGWRRSCAASRIRRSPRRAASRAPRCRSSIWVRRACSPSDSAIARFRSRRSRRAERRSCW